MTSRSAPDFLQQIREKLYVAVLSDVLDEVGFPDQAMPPRIRPLDESLVMVGFARTGLYREVFHVAPGENPYDLEIALIDDLKVGEIPVLAVGSSTRIAPWGELLTTAAKARGGTGCLTDGLVRDIKQIRALQFPVFHGGIGPLDSRGRGKVADIDVPVHCGGVLTRSGDLVVGDADGVVVVPREVEDEVLAKAFAKVAGENATRDELAAGTKLRDVFERHGIL